MAFVQCKLCNRVREVQPHGPAYSTSGYCHTHMNNEIIHIEFEPINTRKRKTITLSQEE